MGSHIHSTCKLYLRDVDKENFTFPYFHIKHTLHFVSWLCFRISYDSRNKEQSFRSQPVISEVASEFLSL